MKSNYYKERDKKYMSIVDECCLTLPPICIEFFDDISLARAASTMASYARQLQCFFDWIHCNIIDDKEIKQFTINDLERITADDVTSFMHELRYKGDSDETLRAYLRAISSFYSHFNKKKKIANNPTDGIIRPKHKKSPKVYLDDTDMQRFEESIKSGSGLSDRQSKYIDTIGSRNRDIALMSMLVDTGIRVSELIGLDMSDIDESRCRISVQRKGGNRDIVYFSDITLEYLQVYLHDRSKIVTDKEQAVFISYVGKNKGHRLSVRSVELMIKKYAIAAGVTDSNKVTPHKLRHTCAMSLLKATGNIALVQKQLGHQNITSTTVYAEADDSDLVAVRNIRAGKKEVSDD